MKTRRCRSCGTPTPVDQFWPGRRGGFGRSCPPCVEAQAHAMDAVRRLAMTWRDDGGWWRKCKGCGKVKRLNGRNYYRNRNARRVRDAYTGAPAYTAVCQRCHRERVTDEHRHRMKFPEVRKAMNAQNAAAMKRRAEANPERAKARRKLEYERLKADPERYARSRELARINHRLKRERRGLPVGPQRKVVVRIEEARLVPSAPVAALIARLLERREMIGRQLGDPTFASMGALCADLGIDERRWRDWRDGVAETMGIGMAERIMQAASVDPSEVFSADDYPEVLARLETAAA